MSVPGQRVSVGVIVNESIVTVEGVLLAVEDSEVVLLLPSILAQILMSPSVAIPQRTGQAKEACVVGVPLTVVGESSIIWPSSAHIFSQEFDADLAKILKAYYTGGAAIQVAAVDSDSPSLATPGKPKLERGKTTHMLGLVKLFNQVRLDQEDSSSSDSSSSSSSDMLKYPGSRRSRDRKHGKHKKDAKDGKDKKLKKDLLGDELATVAPMVEQFGAGHSEVTTQDVMNVALVQVQAMQKQLRNLEKGKGKKAKDKKKEKSRHPKSSSRRKEKKTKTRKDRGPPSSPPDSSSTTDSSSSSSRSKKKRKHWKDLVSSSSSTSDEGDKDRRDLVSGFREKERLRRRLRKDPERACRKFRRKVLRKLDVKSSRQFWDFTRYSLKFKPAFGKMTGLWRTHFYTMELLPLIEQERWREVASYTALLSQAIHQAALDNGSWHHAAGLLPTEDPLERGEWAGEPEMLHAQYKYTKAMRDLKGKLTEGKPEDP